MESQPNFKFPLSPNLFGEEECSVANLKSLLKNPVGFNSCENNDAFHPVNNKIGEYDLYPKWVKQYYENYQCIIRLIIQAQRNKFKNSGQNQNYRFIYIGKGYMIDLENQIQFQINDTQKQRQIIFLKEFDENAEAQRPIGSGRYCMDTFQLNYNQNETNQLNQLQEQNIAQDSSQQNLTSIQQILDGLTSQVEHDIRTNESGESQQLIDESISNNTQAWQFIFNSLLGLDVDKKDSLKYTYLEDPSSTITKSILFLYSMETFLPYTLNKAIRENDISILKNLQPFKNALRNILDSAQFERNAIWDTKTLVFRGSKHTLQELEKYKDIKKEHERRKQIYENWECKLVQQGFTSTSLNKDIAFKFMFKGLRQGQVPVLFQITKLNEKGWSYFKLDEDDYSLFPKEKEVLLNDRSQFIIINILEKEENGLPYHFIELEAYY